MAEALAAGGTDKSKSLMYPKTVNVDFRKLNKETLVNILKHYDVTAKPDASQADLAVMAARMFEATVVLEDEVVNKFIEKHCYRPSDRRQVAMNIQNQQASRRRTHATREALDREPAVPGEQVAARCNTEEADGQWILANVVEWDGRSQAYCVQDEDDPNRMLVLPGGEVRRLEDSVSHLAKGDKVCAVFPETTSFYRAVMAKNPRPPYNEGIVRFKDDEDEMGRSQARRVPARFILRRCDLNEDEDDDDYFEDD